MDVEKSGMFISHQLKPDSPPWQSRGKGWFGQPPKQFSADVERTTPGPSFAKEGNRTRTSNCTPAAPPTIPALLLRFAGAFRKAAAFMVKENGRWVNVSTADFMFGVEELFLGLRALGICPGDRIAIISENRIEWAMADYATGALGAVTVPIYPTLSARQMEYVLRNSGAAVAFVSNAIQLDKLDSVQSGLPDLKFTIVFDESIYRPDAIRLEAVRRFGRAASYRAPADFQRAAQSVQPGDLATIIYTSGTTGAPKGVMLTHGNLMSNVAATSELLPLSPDDVELSFLPLSHIFQRHVDYAATAAGATIAYATDLTGIADDMAQVRPTFAAAVPRFFEKIHSKVLAEVSQSSDVRQHLFRGALGLQRSSPLWPLANRAVFRKIRDRLGGRIRWFISGGAALDPSIAEFFHKIGMPIVEGYGMTEASPVITFSALGHERIGRVGHPVRDVEVRIAEDGEILVRGPNVMAGYYKMKPETEQALQNEWLHTGDLGRFDDAGYLEITGRKKDLIITSTGKNIAPQLLESRLQLIPYFEHAVVIGDGRSFITALVAPNYDAIALYARARGIPFDRPADLLQKQEIYDLAMHEIEARTRDLADYEHIKRIAFLNDPFSIAAGDLTPTLKVRRDEIARKYQIQIDLLYTA